MFILNLAAVYDFHLSDVFCIDWQRTIRYFQGLLQNLGNFENRTCHFSIDRYNQFDYSRKKVDKGSISFSITNQPTCLTDFSPTPPCKACGSWSQSCACCILLSIKFWVFRITVRLSESHSSSS